FRLPAVVGLRRRAVPPESFSDPSLVGLCLLQDGDDLLFRAVPPVAGHRSSFARRLAEDWYLKPSQLLGSRSSRLVAIGLSESGCIPSISNQQHPVAISVRCGPQFPNVCLKRQPSQGALCALTPKPEGLPFARWVSRLQRPRPLPSPRMCLS